MKINKTDLQKALEKVKPALAQKDLIEQSTSFAFLGDRVVTYNDEISISHPVKDLDIKGAIKAQALYDFLNKIKKDEIDIDIDMEESQIVIKAGKSKAGIVMEQEVKLPIEEEIEQNKEWKDLPGNFVDALKFCHPCCSQDMSRPALTCVNIFDKSIQASDSYQIVSYELDNTIPTSAFLIPASSVRNLVKYNIKQVAEGEGWAHFKTEDGTIFSSRVLTSEFPDITAHLEISDGNSISFPEDINEILERAEVFAKKENSGDMPLATVEIKDKRIHISAKNEYGWFEEKSRTEYEGDAVKFLVGIEFLVSMFRKMQQCIIDENKIGFNGKDWRYVVAVMGEE